MHSIFSILSEMGRVWLEAITSPLFFTLYGIVLVFICMQYRRSRPGSSFLIPAFISILAGLLGGFLSSILLLVTGVDLYRVGIAPLWFLALALAVFIHPRFICFAYAGGLLSLYTLINPHTGICISQLLGLVAILHLVESLLIRLDGALYPARIDFQAEGRTHQGYRLQKFWPLLLIMGSTAPSAAANSGQIMPGWWPLLQCYSFGINPSQLGFLPILAILGYGDTATSRTPEEQARRSAWHLFCYSLILLVLALLASSYRWVAWLAACYAPLGHEWIIWRGSRQKPLIRRR